MTLAADETPAPELALDSLRGLYEALAGNIALIAVALIVAVILLAVVWALASAVQRGLGRTAADPLVVGLLGRVVRVVGVIAALLLALSISGVPVLTAVATLGLAGLAVALALQGILENFIAGVILLVRRPLRAGEQVLTGNHEGTVLDIDLRVTKLVTYDGELVLVPNAEVFKNTITNFTRRGRRRTHVRIAVDYRDDHDVARDIVREAVGAVEGVLADPPPEVWLAELADSGVEFEIVYWTLPDMLTVRRVQDRVLGTAKRAVQDTGLTIPWPIRTLVVDGPVQVDRDEP